MMFIKFWNAARWFLLAGSIFIAGMVCAMFVKHPFKDIGDMATWLGAIGTILAFCGTIRIATEQRRKENREALKLGYVYGLMLTERMLHLKLIFEDVDGRLDIIIHQPHVARATGWFAQYKHIKNAVTGHPEILPEHMEKLIVLGCSISEFSAAAWANFEVCKSGIYKLNSNFHPSRKDLVDLRKKLQEGLLTARLAHAALEDKLVELTRRGI